MVISSEIGPGHARWPMDIAVTTETRKPGSSQWALRQPGSRARACLERERATDGVLAMSTKHITQPG